MPTPTPYILIAIPVPMREIFTYLPSADGQECSIGARVLVPFGHRTLIGIVLGTSTHCALDTARLKHVERVIDNNPLMPAELLSFCRWAADYYCYPIGEAIHTALPPALRSDKQPPIEQGWSLTTEGKGLPESALKRSPKQQQILQHLQSVTACNSADIDALSLSKPALKALLDKGIIKKTPIEAPASKIFEKILNEPALTLNNEQQAALDATKHHHFACYLLHGITGSGKTEVYMQLIARTLQSGRQALILVPEIGLSPQTLGRLRKRFAVPIVELHSEISEVQRARNWLNAKTGQAGIIIGTRLAVFAPTNNLGMIIVDEEHDNSYKQQDGFRYSARDCAISRAKQSHIPVILGSATPSLESLYNAQNKRYEHLVLRQRAGGASPPHIKTIDLRGQPLLSGLSLQSLDAIQTTIEKGDQALVFLNRKGYAPTMLCHSCGWIASCRNCSTSMTLHSQPQRLHCHHCNHRQSLPKQCPNCTNTELDSRGIGTEQIEIELSERFSQYPILRIDRGSTRSKTAMKSALTHINKGEPCVLIGTQMLAKGHHFPKLALVVITDADQGFLSPDFRGLEKMGQLLIQVAGRAGRGPTQGQVLVQTHRPDHPLLETLLNGGYYRFAKQILEHRNIGMLPPYWHCVLFRAESKRAENAMQLLSVVANNYRKQFPPNKEVQLVGPMAASIERVQDRYRFQLLIKGSQRKQIKIVTETLLKDLEQHALSKRVRWSVDIDPQEV